MMFEDFRLSKCVGGAISLLKPEAGWNPIVWINIGLLTIIRKQLERQEEREALQGAA